MNKSKSKRIAFIDFEASSLDLGSSYPIEVGYCTLESGPESWLIIPENNWADWDKEAELVHQYKRADLFKYGLPIQEVVTNVNNALEGFLVLCDGGCHDQYWNRMMFSVAGQKQTYHIDDFWKAVDDYLPHTANPYRRAGVVDSIMSAARKKVPGRLHQAGNDALYLKFLFEMIAGKNGMYANQLEAKILQKIYLKTS